MVFAICFFPWEQVKWTRRCLWEKKEGKLKETKHQQKFSFWDRFVYFYFLSLFVCMAKTYAILNLLKLNLRDYFVHEKMILLQLTYNFMTIIVTYKLKCVCLCGCFFWIDSLSSRCGIVCACVYVWVCLWVFRCNK